MTTDEIRAIGAAAMAIAKMAPREGYDEVPLTEIFPTPRARYQFLHEHYMAAAEAAIDAYEAALWRPIGEAPADGDFLVLAPGHVHGDIQACRSRQRQDAKPYRVIGGQFGFDLVRNPTHFHPLPAPPQDPETKP